MRNLLLMEKLKSFIASGIKPILMLCIFGLGVVNANAQTTLVDGDIAFTRINGDDPDSFSFVFLADAESGTTILFSTEYWDAVVDTFSNYYFTIQFTATSNISAGEEAHINADLMQLQFTSGSSLASISSLGPVNPFAGNLIHSGGDNILAFQGSKASPTFIAGISSETGNAGTSGNSWQTNFSVNDTQLPAGKTNAQDGYLGLYPFGTSSLNEYDNARYKPSALHTGDKATLLAAIMDLSNWEFHGSDTFGIVGLPAFNVSSSCSMTASITSQTNVACFGASTGALTVTQSSGAANFDYAWSNGASTSNTASSTNSITGLAATTYTVTITDNNGCTATASSTITQPGSAVAASASVFSALDCNGDTDGQVTATPSGGTSPYTYSWNTGGTSQTETGLGAGTYSVTITDQNGCTDSASTTLTAPSALGASASVSSALDCNGDTDGNVTATPSGGTSPYTYSWNTGGTAQTETGLGAGTYSVTITDQNGCTDSASITLNEPATLSASAIVDSNVTCAGGSDGGLTASPTGGTGPYTYAWSNTATTASITGVSATTFTVTITDANGCTTTASNSVTEPSPIGLNTTAGAGSIDLTVLGAAPPVTYLWSNGATTEDLTGISSGTYTVTVTDNNGCTATTSEMADAGQSICYNTAPDTFDNIGTPTGGSGTYVYQWQLSTDGGSNWAAASGTNDTLNYASPALTQNTLFRRRVIDTGCSDTAYSNTISIIVYTQVVASAALDSTVSCNGFSDGGATASATGGTGPYTYSWNNSATTASITGVLAGTYSVTVTDANGCTDSASVTITEPASLVAASVVDSNVTCNGFSDGGATAAATGGTGAYTYNWSNSATTASITGVLAGTYSVTVTDANGCTDSASITITEPASLVAASVVDSNVSCNGFSDGGATASATGGTMAYSYNWNNGATTASITGVMAGTYSVTVTDANGCTDSASVTITEPAALVAATVADSNVSCNGFSDGGATSSATGGTGPYTYSWSNSATTASITGVLAGTYSVTVTDANGCTDSASITITEPASLVAATVADSNVSCNGFSDGGATASATGGTMAYSYNWNNGATTASITGVMAGTYSVTITDANGCTDSASVTITEPASLVAATVVDSNVTCNGFSDGGATSSATGGTGPYTYSWSNSATTASITGVLAGTYSVTVTDANGCTDSASVTITEPASLVAASVVDSNVTCNGFSDGGATASATGGTMAYSYNWNNGATTASITGVMAGTYSVTITDANGCTDSASVTITEPASLVAATVADSNVSCNGFSDGGATSSATGGTGPYTYNWSNSATTASITGVLAGTYSVTVTDANGCTDSASITITEPASLVAATVADSNVSCNGFSDGGATASATGGTMAYSYNWNNGATTASITGVMAGTYSVTITDANGCTDSASLVITEPAVLMASVAVDSNVSCDGGSDAGLTASATGGTMAYTYAWSNSATTASITGVAEGTYTVSITDANGCTATNSGTTVVADNTAPNAVCQNITVYLNGSGSATISGTDIDGGSTDNCAIDTYSASKTSFGCADVGPNNVTLTITDSNGNLDSCTAVVTVVDTVKPIASCGVGFVFLDAAGNGSITAAALDAGSNDACGIASYSASDTAFTCADVATPPTVVLTVMDNNGNTNTCNVSVLVLDTIAPSITCPGNQTGTVDASCLYTIPDYTGLATATDNCGTPTVTQSPVPGTQVAKGLTTITLTATDGSSNTDVCTFTLDVAGPTAVFGSTAATGCYPHEVTFVDSSVNAASWFWDFGDGSTSNLQNPTHLFDTDTGQYDVMLVVDYGNGCTDTLVKPNYITVRPPVANFTLNPANGCAVPHTVFFTDQSTLPDTWFWTFGDGNTSTAQNPIHTYTAFGTYNVLLTVTDTIFGCSDTATAVVVVQDTTPPTVTCPATQTIYAGGSCTASLPDYTGLATVVDACDGSPSVTQSPAIGTSLAAGTHTITIYGEDWQSNIDSCSFTLVVADSTAPTAVCQNITVYLDGSGNATITAADVDGGSTDNCSVASLAINDSAFTCADVGANTVTLTVTDTSGNSSTCNATVTVADTTSPTAVCQNITVYLDGSGNASISSNDLDGGSSDNCSIASFEVNDSLFTCSDVGANTVTLTVNDVNGNSSTCTATVTVLDTVAPTITCPANITVSALADNCFANASWSSTANDNCSGYVVTSSHVSGSIFPVGVTTVTDTVTDASGNQTTCSFTITVTDDQDPEITGCPANISVSASSSTCGNTVNWTAPTASDNCPGVSLNSTHTPGSFFPVGTTTVTYVATDAVGNLDSCQFTVTVIDSIAPTAVCQNLTVYLDASGNASITSADVDNGSSDNCGVASLSVNDSLFNCSEVGANTITLTVTDIYGNTSTCNSTVTVVDSTAPTAVCQNITVYLNSSGTATITAADVDGGSSDVCGAVSLAVSDTSFSCSDIGANTVTLTVTDVNSNTSTCTATVTVADTTSPVASCQNINVYLDGSGNASITTGDIDNGSSDACGIDTMTLSTSSFTCANVGPNTVTLTVTDNNGNTSTCTSLVSVFDTISPAAVCQDITVYLSGSGSATITAADVDGGSSDECGILLMTVSDTSFTCSDVGANTVTLTVTDNNANVSTCTATVTVVDSTAPTAVCQNLTVYLDATGNASITAADVDNGSSDVCGAPSLSISDSSFTCSDVGANTVTLTATDVNGNSATCTSVVTVVDSTPPVASCQTITVFLDASGNATITAADVDNGSSDACGIDSLSLSNYNFTCANQGPNSVTLTVTDNNGNSSTCVGTVFVVDTVSPVAVCQDITVYLSASGFASITASDIDNGSSDACGISSLAINDSSFTCSDVGANTVTLTVTDIYSNSSTCNATVTVVDTVSPVAVCQNITVFLDASGNASITAGDIDNGSSDACGIGSLAADVTSFTCSNVGANTVTLTATDVNGNSATCTSTVTVVDTVSPVASCQNITVYLDASGNTSIVAADVDNGSSDACGIDTMTIDVSSFTCSDVGANTVTLLVTDNNGNSSTCTSTVTVMDTVSPVASCQDITVYLDANGIAFITATDIDNGSTDACGIATLALDDTSFTCSDVGANTVTLLVTDNNNNWSTCTATVTVMDTVSPVASCQDITVYLDGLGSASIVAADVDNGSSDACGIDTMTIDMSSFSCANVGANTVTLTVTDNNGNISTCTSTVTVMDTISPIASCQDITVYLDANGLASIVAADVDNFSADNCGVDTMTIDMSDFTCVNVGANTVTLTVTDNNGNTSTCTSTVTVMDTIAPTAICQDITVYLDASGNTSIVAADIDNGSSDNCAVASISASPTSFTCGDVGANTVTLTVTDVNGNTSTCTSTVTVMDTVPPTAICRNVTLQLNANGTTSVSASNLNNGSFDNCGGPLTFSASQTQFTCANVGANNVTLTVTDVNGNTSTCIAVVTVEDNIPPVAVCQNVTVQLDANGLGSITAAQVDAGSTDNCGVASVALDVTSFTCANIGANTVVMTVTDVNGNASTCNAVVTVVDLIPPTAICQAITVQLDASGNASIAAADVDGGSQDVCSAVTLSVSPSTFTCANVGDNTVTLTVTDASGNTSTCNTIVAVEDTISPVAVCQDITIALDNNGSASIDGVDVDGGSTDACGIASLSVTPNTFTCADLGSGNTVTLTVTDNNGNTSTCTATVTVEDNTLPQFFCPANITVNNDPGVCGAVVTYTPPSGSDNCTSLTVTQTDNTGLSSGDVFPVGTTVLTYTGTDGSGNVTTCSFSITVIDNEKPVISLPANITVCATSTSGAVVTYPTVTATDNCQVNTLSQSSGFGSGSVFPVGTTTNFFIATDIYGNVRTSSFTVTVLPMPNAGFTASNACFGDAVAFTNTSTGTGLQYDWDFGDGNSSITQNPTHTYASSGTYTVTLTTSNGTCSATVSNTVTVYPEVTATATTTSTTCNGGNDGSITVTPASGTAPYSYALNGATPQASGAFTNLPAGSHTIEVTDANGCSTTVTATVGEPTALGFDVTAANGVTCKDDNDGSLTIAATGGTSPYFYSIDGGPNHASGVFNFLTGGNHTITITDANGCTYTSTANVPVTTAAPVAAYSFDIEGLEVLLTDLSTGATDYYWDFGDGNTSTSVNPTHVFVDPGAYTITLIVSNECGSDTLSINLGQLFTGVDDIDNSAFLNLYPNPNNGSFTIEFESSYNFDRLAMRVWSVEGRLISDSKLNATGNTYREDFSYQLAPGVYHVEFMVDDRTYHKRVVVR